MWHWEGSLPACPLGQWDPLGSPPALLGWPKTASCAHVGPLGLASDSHLVGCVPGQAYHWEMKPFPNSVGSWKGRKALFIVFSDSCESVPVAQGLLWWWKPLTAAAAIPCSLFSLAPWRHSHDCVFRGLIAWNNFSEPEDERAEGKMQFAGSCIGRVAFPLENGCF